MRLGLVIYGSLDQGTGGYLYDRRLAENLRRMGHTIGILSLPQKAYAAQILDNLIHARRLTRERRLSDIVLQDELNHPSLFAQPRRARARGLAPAVAIVHHLRSQEDHPAWIVWLYRAIERAYLRSVDGFVFNAQATRHAVERLIGGPSHGVVAPPGGDHVRRPASQADIGRRAERGGPARLLFAGSLTPRKGLHHLLQALAGLPAEGWRLAVAGDDQVDSAYTHRVRRLISELGLESSVRLLGRLDRRRLEAEMASADVFCLPSHVEGYGIAYLEAMAFGLPVLASASGGASELVQEGVTGYLIPPGDIIKLRVRLEALIGDRELRWRLGLAGRQRYSAQPTWEETASRAEAFLSQFVHKEVPEAFMMKKRATG